MKAEVPQYAVQDEVCVDPAKTALVVIDVQKRLCEAGRQPARAGRRADNPGGRTPPGPSQELAPSDNGEWCKHPRRWNK